MKKTFTLGAVSGMAALVLAVPVLSQVVGAAMDDSSSTVAIEARRQPFTEETLQTLIDRDDAFLKNADAIVAVLKSATQAHRTALSAALTMTDATEQKAAVRAAQEEFRTSIKTAIEANPDLKSAALGFKMGGHRGGHKGGMRGPPQQLLETLGMTADELKAAIESGKTIEELAKEKGVTLPARPAFKMRFDASEDDDSSAQ